MRKRSVALALILALTTALSLHGQFKDLTVQIPVDRIVTNVETWIKEKPQDAQAYYVLGRIHAMAYAYGPQLTLWNNSGNAGGADADPFGGQLPGFTPFDSIRVERRATNPAKADDIKHLVESMKHYRRAIELDPTNAIYELGLAWMFEEAANIAKSLPADFGDLASVKPTDAEKASYDAAFKKLGDSDSKVREEATKFLATAMPKPYAQLLLLKSDDPETTARAESLLKGHWDLQALDHYRKAHTLARESDLARRVALGLPDDFVSSEAGERMLDIFKTQPQAAMGNEARDLTEHIKAMRNKGSRVTPIVFAMPGTPAEHMPDLLDPAKRVTFDLAGDEVPREWPWLKDGTALLVWDPGLSGKITNGTQLFGSRTWWIFFRNGYEALSTLDDNRDGKLSGPETHGIAVWIDKNGDAISQPGEVIPLDRAGITAIDIRYTTDHDGTPISQSGIEFRNGTTVKSFDWITQPLAPIKSRSTIAQ